ncbi:MAG: hypothetical protein AAB348_00390 [Patescibacteria group bacterium]
MKQTILSAKQSELLENLIGKYGLIVTSDNIVEVAKNNWDYKQAKNLITKLNKNGWLIRIKRGLYAISELTGRGFLSISPYLVANLLVKDSYVSFESALQYHNMFDQLMNKTISVSLKMYKAVKLNNMEYSFVKTKESLYFGFEEARVENKVARIATAEKALIDMVNFRRSKLTIDVVIEKIINHKQDLDFNHFNKYLSKFSGTTIKILGLIFDFLSIDSSKLYELVKHKHGTHWMLAGDKKFNAKWRLYYDEYFDQYNQKSS